MANELREMLSGTIENVVYRNDKNDYTVLDVVDEEENLVSAVGIMPLAFEGECVKLYGRWTYHKEFGKQFSFDSFEKTLPEEEEGILQYLSSRTVKGIGPVTALKIVNRYGKDSFDVIENHPEWLADIPGITLKKAAAISTSFKEQAGIRGVIMFCKDYMDTPDVAKVYKHLGAGAVGIIKENPYVLCEGEISLSFDKVDALAQSLGIALDARNRLMSGMKYLLLRAATSSGHTCLPEDQLVLGASEMLDVGEDEIRRNLNSMLDSSDLSCYRRDGINYIMTNESAEAEDCIVRHLMRIANEAERFDMADMASLVEKVENGQNIRFAGMQREALYNSLRHGIMILTGGPGTGKTTVVKALISIFNSIGFKTALAAPTGRAAKRLSEATGEEAKTVHRMLEMERTSDGNMRFCRNEKNPISERVIIVDEASMLDLTLTAALVSGMRRGARLILIGDSNQLPSVGAGNVLADLIASERVSTVRLTEIFRQSKESLIITNAHKINSGEAPILNVTDNDFFFVRREREDEIPDTVATLISQRLPKSYGQDIKDKIQVITPSRKGFGGAITLNSALQARLNPPAQFKTEKNVHGTIFREGDKVMQITNNYDVEWEKNGAVGIGLFNGDIGVIEKINLREETLTVNFDERYASYTFDMLDELELAYAITVHKSQGSEYPVVILPVYFCAPMLMTRNLLYTAVTRAKSMVILVGRAEIPGKMVDNNREIMRYTVLKDKICDYI